MLRTVTSPFNMSFTRSGGALITARADVWKADPGGWVHIAQFEFSNPTLPAEQLQGTLPSGSYTCVFKCYVEESLNGIYSFDFQIGGVDTYNDDGDVNSTSAGNDSKVYKDQFILEIQ